MCKVQKLIYTCGHHSEHHLSNCLNRYGCPAQMARANAYYIAIGMQADCPPCQLSNRKKAILHEMLDATSMVRNAKDKLAIQRVAWAKADALKEEYGAMEHPFDTYKKPKGLPKKKWEKKSSCLKHSATLDDFLNVAAPGASSSDPSQDADDVESKFDIGLLDDEDAEEDHEVGEDGAVDSVANDVDEQELPGKTQVEEYEDDSDEEYGDDDGDEFPYLANALRETRRKQAVINYWKRKDSGEQMW